MFFNLLTVGVVLLLLAVAVIALVYANLPMRWQRRLAPGAQGFSSLRGDFRRTLGRWEVADIVRDISRTVERSAQVTLNHAFLPNRVRVALAPGDGERFEALLPQIQGAVEERLARLKGKPVNGKGTAVFTFVGRLKVDLGVDASVPDGTAKVDSGFAADTIVEARTPDLRAPRAVRPEEARWLLGDRSATHELAGHVLVGRDAECGLRLNDRRVSVRHALLIVDEQGVLLEDLRSANGTRVNGELVDSPRRLFSGDLISFGGASAMRLVWDRPTIRC